MRVALITTSINVPRVLALYRKLDPSVFFFVAADEKTPLEAYSFCADIPDCEIYSPDRQKELGYECSSLIGWNTISRRNIVLLEALKWGADTIVTVDDDNIPIERGYFGYVREALDFSFVGCGITCKSGWFDVGELLDPFASHRGIPTQVDTSEGCVGFLTEGQIGVAAGICLGDPDVSAITRIANHPTVHRVSELLRAGIAVDPHTTWTVFNSQNTAFIRELAPCFLMVPQFGRFDDIFASLIAQRVMREKNLHVHFGQPFVWQQRNQHDLLKDLRAEMWGQEHILEFANYIDRFLLGGDRASSTWVADSVRTLYYECAYRNEWMPTEVVALSQAWLEDCRKVMG
jgi:hypothetical protein